VSENLTERVFSVSQFWRISARIGQATWNDLNGIYVGVRQQKVQRGASVVPGRGWAAAGDRDGQSGPRRGGGAAPRAATSTPSAADGVLQERARVPILAHRTRRHGGRLLHHGRLPLQGDRGAGRAEHQVPRPGGEAARR